MKTKSNNKQRPTWTRTQWFQWAFLTLFAGVAIALSIPGMLAEDDGFLNRESDKAPKVVKVGWRRGSVQGLVEGLEETDLEKLFSTEARDTGIALFALLVFSCVCAGVVLILGYLGFCFDVWFARTGFAVSCLGALAGITLLFVAPKFLNEVNARVKIRTRERLDVICDEQVVCEDVFRLDECEGRHTKSALNGEKLICSQEESQGAPLKCSRGSTEGADVKEFKKCATDSFMKDCSLPGVVCKVSNGSPYKATLGLGLHWLLFGMVTVAIFIPKINLKPVQGPPPKPPSEV
ncbi:hypothetical protein BSKO_06701 [Bryopsis sp. KO-2023]|nr:hypothetical protein BSKO_06701 [Bryopsis sp. KO-2023]